MYVWPSVKICGEEENMGKKEFKEWKQKKIKRKKEEGGSNEKNEKLMKIGLYERYCYDFEKKS